MHDFFTAAGMFNSVVIFFLGFVLILCPIGLVSSSIVSFDENESFSFILLSWIVFAAIFSFSLWGFIYEIREVNHSMEVRAKAEVRENRIKQEALRSRQERDFLYAIKELDAFVDSLGGKSLGCSNYEQNGDFIPCSLATDRDVILEVKCPSKEGVHGCLLTDKAYSVLRSKGYDINISSSNSNVNSTIQKND